MTPKQLARIHRVREVQVALAEADHARAEEKAGAERRLDARVAELAADVAPAIGAGSASDYAATAHFRERLQQSAATAGARVQAADAQLARDAARVIDAKRDRAAAEKLLDRAQARVAADARRAPEPLPTRRDRHDPC